MRKILFLALAIGLMSIAGCEPIAAQGLQVYDITNPNTFPSGACYAQPTQYAPVNALASPLIFPWYTTIQTKDTVSNTGADTFWCKMGYPHKSVYTWCHVNQITGTNTSCTLKLYATADSGTNMRAVDYVQVYSVTVGTTNPAAYYLFNSGSGWPYTGFRWIFTGVGTHESSVYSGLMVR